LFFGEQVYVGYNSFKIQNLTYHTINCQINF
jgi:hypothetical protein